MLSLSQNSVPIVQENELLNYEHLKSVYSSEKKSVELLKKKIVAIENGIIERLDKGALVDSSNFKVDIAETIRRPVKWRAVVVEKLGLDYLNSTIESTAAKITRNLLVTKISNI